MKRIVMTMFLFIMGTAISASALAQVNWNKVKKHKLVYPKPRPVMPKEPSVHQCDGLQGLKETYYYAWVPGPSSKDSAENVSSQLKLYKKVDDMCVHLRNLKFPSDGRVHSADKEKPGLFIEAPDGRWGAARSLGLWYVDANTQTSAKIISHIVYYMPSQLHNRMAAVIRKPRAKATKDTYENADFDLIVLELTGAKHIKTQSVTRHKSLVEYQWENEQYISSEQPITWSANSMSFSYFVEGRKRTYKLKRFK